MARFETGGIRVLRRLDHGLSATRLRLLAVLLALSAAGGEVSSEPAPAESFTQIQSPEQARGLGLDSLHQAIQRDGGVPLPERLDDFIKDRRAALQLGKALFWDMQVGSDGVQACASCHFHAGADNRSTNQLNPNTTSFVNLREDDVQGYFNASRSLDIEFHTRQPGARLSREDFPFIKSIQDLTENADGSIRPTEGNSNDIGSSMGVFLTLFDGIEPGSPADLGTPLQDRIWQSENGESLRRVEPRNTPTVINAVFNFTNFWEGRANPHFNGQNAFGDQDPGAFIVVNDPSTGLGIEQISLANASLASQAVSPTLSFFEMSFIGRQFPDIGIKMLRRSQETGSALVPLGLQKVHPLDSVLGPLSNSPEPGLKMAYEEMIKKAFADRYWNSDEPVELNAVEYTHMEANFSLFFGLAVALYESTLVSDRSSFDTWMESGRFNSGFRQNELAGLNLFVNEGQCISCHTGPEFTSASIRAARGGANTIGAMAMTDGNALFDTGFFNISVTPTTDDIGRGDRDPFDQPLAFSRQALFDRLGVAPIGFPILGGDRLPALDDGLEHPVCEDQNGSGFCERNEPINPDFQRVAVDGAFKTPGLRNTELTGPYFHNGGMATLRQVVQFYNRGGNFCRFNVKDLDPTIQPLGLSSAQEEQLVRFLLSLTDSRVKFRRAPFDHPEIRIPEDGQNQGRMRTIRAVGASGSPIPLNSFLNLNPRDGIFTPDGVCSKD
ncbi:MAG: conjugal transfer protein [Methylococcaceae bacterium]|nr:conjugal transfer protein [Methylococcaceae bacterium]